MNRKITALKHNAIQNNDKPLYHQLRYLKGMIALNHEGFLALHAQGPKVVTGFLSEIEVLPQKWGPSRPYYHKGIELWAVQDYSDYVWVMDADLAVELIANYIH